MFPLLTEVSTTVDGIEALIPVGSALFVVYGAVRLIVWVVKSMQESVNSTSAISDEAFAKYRQRAAEDQRDLREQVEDLKIQVERQSNEIQALRLAQIDWQREKLALEQQHHIEISLIDRERSLLEARVHKLEQQQGIQDESK